MFRKIFSGHWNLIFSKFAFVCWISTRGSPLVLFTVYRPLSFPQIATDLFIESRMTSAILGVGGGLACLHPDTRQNWFTGLTTECVAIKFCELKTFVM